MKHNTMGSVYLHLNMKQSTTSCLLVSVWLLLRSSGWWSHQPCAPPSPHNKLPVQERLFRIQLSRDPYCVACPTASIQDVSHYFMKCGRTNYYWNWTKELSYSILGHRNVDEVALLRFNRPKSCRDRDISWLIGHYIFIVCDMLFKKKLKQVGSMEFFGYMRFKYKEAKALNAVTDIAGLLWSRNLRLQVSLS